MMKSLFKFVIAFLIASIIAYFAVTLFFIWKKASHSADVNSSDTASVFNDVARQVVTSLGFGSKCDVPFHYAIGSIDPQFNIDKDTLKTDMLRAESDWELAFQKNILTYDESSEFKVNLIFDERQKATLESKNLAKQLDTVQNLQAGISKSYDTLTLEYDTKKTQYERDLQVYQKQSEEYNARVRHYNSHENATEVEYKQLEKQRENLDAFSIAIESKRKKLNELVGTINTLVAEEKNVVALYNKEVTTFENIHGQAKEFDQGVYTGKEINIYQYNEESDLVLVLAHELGHALGLNHVENSESIMYYLMAKQNLDDIKPSEQDLQALDFICQS